MRDNECLVPARYSFPFSVVLVALVAADALVAPLPAADAEGIPWGKTILAQPYDQGKFQQINPPAWVEDTLGVGYTLSGQDRQARAQAVAHGVTISELIFVDPLFVYYDSQLLKKRSPHVPLDKLTSDIAEYKRLGIRVLAVYPPCLQGEVYENHPDWRRIATDTAEIPTVDLERYPHGGMLCLLGPYGDFFIDVLAEIATQFPQVDAFSFDGLHYGGVCYCRHCRDNYRHETGEEIPPVDLNDLRFRRYQHWADRRLEALIQRMQNRLKGIKPTLALVTWTTNAGRFGHLRDIPRNMPARMNLLLDAPDQEFWMDESNRGTTVVPAFANAYMWAVSNHRVAFSEPYLMSHGNPYGKDSFPPHEIERRMLLALTHGVAPSIAVGQPANLQAAVYHSLEEIRRRRPWLTHKTPEPWAALLMSDNTRNFYGRNPGYVEERYLAHVLGFFRAALEEHLPMTVINDWNLTPEELAPFRVLILPNAACLSDEQVGAVQEFVARGGGLIGSMDVSLCDEFGTPRTELALGSTFGIRRQGVAAAPNTPQDLDVNFARTLDADYWETRKNIWDFRRDTAVLETPRLQAYLGGAPVTFKGPVLNVEAEGEKAQVIGTVSPRSEIPGAPQPAVIVNGLGRGRTLYFAAGFDSAYYLYPYPYQRLLLKYAIERVAGSQPPITVTAPMCVQAVTMRQRLNGERLVVHLYNDLNTTAHHALPNDDVPLREEVVPIHDVRVRFTGYDITEVHLEPNHTVLDVNEVDGGREVLVPKLDIHCMIVAELDNPQNR